LQYAKNIHELFRTTTTLLVLMTFIVTFNPAPSSYFFATARAQMEGEECFNVSSSRRTIEVTCDTTFAQLAKGINGDSVLEDMGNGEYLLSADLRVDEGARLVIASPEVTWVKISNQGGSDQYNIVVRGYMDIKGVKVTSWDPDTNSVVGQDTLGSVPRPYIRYQDAQGGVIENSELAYMGQDGEKRRGFSLGGTTTNIVIRNNDFHHWWYAFYCAGVANITLDGNKYHDNHAYAIDPHSGTHDMKITNNHVYHNAGYGIICSEDCFNILIEGNRVHDNPLSSITLSKNVHNSTVSDNLVYNSDKGTNFNASPENEVYNNTIRNVTLGFYITQPEDGSIGHSTENEIYNNTVENAHTAVATNLDTVDNIFANNNFLNSKFHDFLVEGGSEIIIENQTFTNYKIAGSSGRVTIQNSGTIEVEGETFDTDNNVTPYSINPENNMTMTVSSK
jgi:poly(beta-D-mannuronate) C5 epimerase